jgi:hypothetical protein
MPKIEASSGADALRRNGCLHVQAYLLRLLDRHRPAHPLAFLHCVLHRSEGGMTLPLPLLVEFVASTVVFPPAALIRTIVFSTRDVTLNLEDTMHRSLVMDAAALVSRSLGEDQLPTNDALVNVLDASAAGLFIFSVARSRVRLLKRLGSGESGGSHRLRVVLEIDATSDSLAASAMQLLHPAAGPSSALSSSSSSAEEGGHGCLLSRVAGEVLWLTLLQPHKCRVVVLLVSDQAKLRDPSSPASRLLAVVKEVIGSVDPPALREAFSVGTGDCSTAVFPVLAGLSEAPPAAGSGGRSGAPTDGEVVTLWLREPAMHSVVLLQSGHLVEPFLRAGSGIGLPETATLREMVGFQRRSADKPPSTCSPPAVPCAASRASLLLTHLLHSMCSMALPTEGNSVLSLATANIIVIKGSIVEQLGKLRSPSPSTASSAVSVAARLIVRARLEEHKASKILLEDKTSPNPNPDSASSAAAFNVVPCIYTGVGQGLLVPAKFIGVPCAQDEVGALSEAATTIRQHCVPDDQHEILTFPWERVWSVLSAESWTDLVNSDPLALLGAHPSRSMAGSDGAGGADGTGSIQQLFEMMPQAGRLSAARWHLVKYLGEEPPGLKGIGASVALTPGHISEMPFWLVNLPPPTPPKVSSAPEKKKTAADTTNAQK